MKTKGALPVPYIVALIIAILVIAVLIYYFLIIAPGPGNELDVQKCNARAVTYCASWAASGYDTARSVVGPWKDDLLGGKDCDNKKIITSDRVDRPGCEKFLGTTPAS